MKLLIEECPENNVYMVTITYTWNNLELDEISTFKNRYDFKLNNQCSSNGIPSSMSLVSDGRFGFTGGVTEFECCYSYILNTSERIISPTINCQCCTVKNWSYFYNRS